jgi:hypothetical protein
MFRGKSRLLHNLHVWPFEVSLLKDNGFSCATAFIFKQLWGFKQEFLWWGLAVGGLKLRGIFNKQTYSDHNLLPRPITLPCAPYKLPCRLKFHFILARIDELKSGIYSTDRWTHLSAHLMSKIVMLMRKILWRYLLIFFPVLFLFLHRCQTVNLNIN